MKRHLLADGLPSAVLVFVAYILFITFLGAPMTLALTVRVAGVAALIAFITAASAWFMEQ